VWAVLDGLIDLVSLFVSFYFATLDSNAAENEEGGDFGGFEEEDQGHFAEQVKPRLAAHLS
jgi:hypothetical protein